MRLEQLWKELSHTASGCGDKLSQQQGETSSPQQYAQSLCGEQRWAVPGVYAQILAKVADVFARKGRYGRSEEQGQLRERPYPLM